MNNSASLTIEVKATSVFTYDTTETSIESGTTDQIEFSSQLGGTDRVQLPTEVFSDLLITNATGDTMQINYAEMSNWEIDIRQAKKVPSLYKHTYTLVVDDADF